MAPLPLRGWVERGLAEVVGLGETFVMVAVHVEQDVSAELELEFDAVLGVVHNKHDVVLDKRDDEQEDPAEHEHGSVVLDVEDTELDDSVLDVEDTELDESVLDVRDAELDDSVEVEHDSVLEDKDVEDEQSAEEELDDVLGVGNTEITHVPASVLVVGHADNDVSAEHETDIVLGEGHADTDEHTSHAAEVDTVKVVAGGHAEHDVSVGGGSTGQE